MKTKDIAFISTRNRGLTPDLRIVKDYLAENIEDAAFSYLTVNENIKNPLVKKGIVDTKKNYCKNIKNAIAVDGSLPGKLEKEAAEGSRILIAAPYDYQFKAMTAVGKDKKKKTFYNFSHVLPGSPFGKELFEKCYNISNSEIMDGICNPFAWDLNQDAQIVEKRKRFIEYFPEMEGKKVVSILLNGEPEREDYNPFADFDWVKFFEKIKGEWFVFTNNMSVIENLVRLDYDHKEAFGYVNKMLDAREVLYFSDCVFTNSGLYASYFSSKKKPVYCLKYSDTGFEKYMKKNYPELYVEKLGDIYNMDIDKYSEENEKFTNMFSYDVSKNPNEEILKVLKKTL